jgi:hypothetical protein
MSTGITGSLRLPVELIWADGTIYEQQSRVEFANQRADQNLGTIQSPPELSTGPKWSAPARN